jgi:hypothetical protein
MISKEDFILERLLTFRKNRSGKYVKEILVALNQCGYYLNHDLLQKEIDSRGLRDCWEIVKEVVFTSRLNY